MALPKDMRLKGHRTFNYIHKNSIKFHGKLMTFKVAKSNPEILLFVILYLNHKALTNAAKENGKPRTVIPAIRFIIKSLFAGPPS